MTLLSHILAHFCLTLSQLAGPAAQPKEFERPWPIIVSELASIERTYHQLEANRAHHISRLHFYAAAGKFPLNTDYPNQLVPYFVDKEGTACAVGHLMLLDDQHDLVKSISLSTNHIRIEDVHSGPLLDWIHNSGLTQDECALIQPSYACIEDYRQGRPWQDEVARLKQHFAKVEQTLTSESRQSLRKALVAKVDERLAQNPDDPALSLAALSDALQSDEPNVRIAAAHVLSRTSTSSRKDRLTLLFKNLSDTDPAVRFWSAVAVETIGAASSTGERELHYRTLPVFLDTWRKGPEDLRLASIVMLASLAPETMGTDTQLRIMPEIRRAMVRACSDRNGDISTLAKSVLDSFRWQRCVCESQRIPRHYLAASADLEALATETLAVGREFVELPESVAGLVDMRSFYDVRESITYSLPTATSDAPPIADTASEAEQIVDDGFRKSYAKYLGGENPVRWKIDSTTADTHNLFFIVAARIDHEPSAKLLYVIPRRSMLSATDAPFHSWFERDQQADQSPWPTSPSSPVPGLKPNPNAHIQFGEVASGGEQAFTATCDLLVSFIASRTQVVIDREVTQTAKMLTWSGRFARLRQYRPRFFEQGGGGSSVFGGGGWDFQRLGIACDRSTGIVTLSGESIEYPVEQLPADVLSPEWTTDELKLMGWKPLTSLDYFGQKLFPKEYYEAVESFDPNNARELHQQLYRRYYIEKTLPGPEFIIGLLYDRAGKPDLAAQQMKSAAHAAKYDPAMLAEIAKWELSKELYADARQHAEGAVKLWPEQPLAFAILKQLDNADKAE